jgi:cytochrome P460
MKSTLAAASSVLCALPLVRLMPTVASKSLSLPAAVADYRTWRSPTTEPQPVPLALWSKCSAPTVDERAAAYKEHGPHAERYIRVYANPLAFQTLTTASRSFANGAIIAKEKLVDPSDPTPSGVAFMVKREGAAFRNTGGWEFQYFPAGGDGGGVHEACASCHRAATGSRYVLGEYTKR